MQSSPFLQFPPRFCSCVKMAPILPLSPLAYFVVPLPSALFCVSNSCQICSLIASAEFSAEHQNRPLHVPPFSLFSYQSFLPVAIQSNMWLFINKFQKGFLHPGAPPTPSLKCSVSHPGLHCSPEWKSRPYGNISFQETHSSNAPNKAAIIC